MTSAQVYTIAAITIPLLFAARNKLRPDHAALFIAFLLGLGQFVGLAIFSNDPSPESVRMVLIGFGQPVTITLISLFVITGSLEKYGIARWMAARLSMLGNGSESRLIALYAGAAAALSLLMNNVAAGALLLPSALESAKRSGIAPSKLLMPVSYGTLLGGGATYFTTANIIASGLLLTANPPQQPLGILDFTPTGGLIALGGLLFIAIFGPRLLPNRTPHEISVDAPDDAIMPRQKVMLSVLILFASVTAAVLGIPTYLAMLGGLVATLILGVMSSIEAYNLVDWRTIVLVAGMYPVGVALTHTGIAQALSQMVVTLSTPLGALGLAAGIYLLTAALTQLIGGQVTALVTAPLAISAAIQAGISPQAIAVTVAIACQAAYFTPMAHPVNTLMLNAGGYRFSDFWRLGSGVFVVSFVMILVGLKLFWGI
ncbi:MAG: hypothetical protein OHK0023_12910 [Anaerolineae bacterium]